MKASALAAVALLAGGCTGAPGPVVPRPTASLDRTEALLVPSGHGSLLQDEITLTIRSGLVQLKVTPLEEWVLRLTAPDTWSRLSALAAVHRVGVERETGIQDAPLFLVSFFSDTPGAAFNPQDVQVENRGRRQRPTAIRPLTAGWGEERLRQQEPQLAVYAFSEAVDLEQPFLVYYGAEVDAGWEEILRKLEAERERARARAGVGGR